MGILPAAAERNECESCGTEENEVTGLRHSLETALQVADGLIDLFTFNDDGTVGIHPQFAFHLKVAARMLRQLRGLEPFEPEVQAMTFD